MAGFRGRLGFRHGVAQIVFGLVLLLLLAACGEETGQPGASIAPPPGNELERHVSKDVIEIIVGGSEVLEELIDSSNKIPGVQTCGIPDYFAKNVFNSDFRFPARPGLRLESIRFDVIGNNCMTEDNQLVFTVDFLNGISTGKSLYLPVGVFPSSCNADCQMSPSPLFTIGQEFPGNVEWHSVDGIGALRIVSLSALTNAPGAFNPAFVRLLLTYAPSCGNSQLDNMETCDDGNTTAKDGCSATCTVETGYTCPETGACSDIDECASPNTNSCSATHATCTNTVGSYTCACNPGYEGNGLFCEDSDECASANTNSCSPNATCTNTAGSYACTCKDGYTGNGRSCVDYDECASGNNGCATNATCTNTVGSYTCACPLGWAGPGTTCEQCPAGSFSDIAGSASCKACDIGTYAPAAGSSQCLPCPKGMANNQTGQAICQACSPGFFAADIGYASCEPCEKGYYAEGQKNTSCTACPGGTANNATGQASCQPCAPGYESRGMGAFACEACPAGKLAATSGTNYCSECPQGTANNQIGQSSCQACGKGFFAAEIGSKACEACPSGSYSDVTGSASCASCEKGYANQENGQSSCLPCSKGFFAAQLGSKACEACPSGSYSDATGSASCSTCPSGSYSAEVGQSACTSCVAGTFAAASGSLFCTPCAVGHYADGLGSIACAPCPAGQITDTTGSASCTRCEYGYVQPQTGQSTCTICPAGTDSRTSDLTECHPCGEGMIAPLPGTVYCGGCDVGKYANVEHTACLDCPAGTQKPNGLKSCEACPEGTASSRSGQTKCPSCQVGSFAFGTGNTSCTLCAPGNYSAASGSKECQPCAAGTYAAESGQSACNACETGFVSQTGASFCTTVCGDTLLAGKEVCDDGNTSANDGCSADCLTIEDGWQCPTAGKPCEAICRIAEVVYQKGDANPANPCQICDPGQTWQTWSSAARGSACSSDNLDCTRDVCNGSGACTHPLDSGCLIDGACIADGATKTDAPCLACRPTLAGNTYSALPYGSACTSDEQAATLDICNGAGLCTHPVANDCTIDGKSVAAGSADPQNPCRWCDPSASRTAYSPRASGFACESDDLPCTVDACDGEGTCAHPLVTGCIINDGCVAEGALDPENDCQACTPNLATLVYSSLAAGVACADDTIPSTADTCNGQGLCQHVSQNVCTIDGVTYQGGATDPSNACRYCEAASNAAAWSLRASGFPCSDDGLSCTVDSCDAQGQCGHAVYAGCLIAGACVAAGATAPSNECQVCAPDTATNGYSPKAKGELCTDDGKSYTSDTCNESGLCTHTNSGSCEIDSVRYDAGVTNPQNACQACDATKTPDRLEQPRRRRRLYGRRQCLLDGHLR